MSNRIRTKARCCWFVDSLAAAPLVVSLLVSACGGGGTDASSSIASPAVSSNAANSASAPSVTVGAMTATIPAIDASKLAVGSRGIAVDQTAATTELAVPSNIGAFRTVCDFSHMSFDDPIVYPGQPGKSHLHAFFGNTGINAHSTAASVANTGNSTCRGGTVDRTGYWVPAIIDTRDGTPVAPRVLSIYYKTGYSGIAPSAIQAFPEGLRMIAGDSRASSDLGPAAHFRCQGGPRDNLWTATIPDCLTVEELAAGINFPQCWDGVNLDSPDHKSHMSYPSNGKCPSTHSVAVPEINFSVAYPVPMDHVTTRWRLASDNYDSSKPAGYSLHADWFNGWKPDIQAAWIKGCNQASMDCHSHLLGDGRRIY